MLGRFATLVLALCLLAPPAAQAQAQISSDELTLEFGLAAFDASSTGGGGVYVGLSGADRRAKWLEPPYFAMNAYASEVTGSVGGTERYLAHGGANIRLGPARWLVRPVVRVGLGLAKYGERMEFTGLTRGLGLYTRQGSALWGLLTAGFAFTLDLWSTGEDNSAVAHAGVYFRFG